MICLFGEWRKGDYYFSFEIMVGPRVLRLVLCSMVTMRVTQTRNVNANIQTDTNTPAIQLLPYYSLYISKEPGPHLTFTWRVLEAVSNWCRWWRWGRHPSARPVGRKRRPGPTSGTVCSTPGWQLRGGRQGPRCAAISVHWRRWWERAWSKRKMTFSAVPYTVHYYHHGHQHAIIECLLDTCPFTRECGEMVESS